MKPDLISDFVVGVQGLAEVLSLSRLWDFRKTGGGLVLSSNRFPLDHSRLTPPRKGNSGVDRKEVIKMIRTVLIWKKCVKVGNGQGGGYKFNQNV